MEKKNILFLFISLPNLLENGVFVDLIKEFANQGHNVKVATPAIRNSIIGLNMEAGIEVVRFKTDQLTNNTSNIEKGIAYIKLIFQFTRAIFKHYRKDKFDVIIAHSLPAEIGIIASILKWYFNSKFYLMLCEYVWQDAVSLGFIKDGGIICKYYQMLEKLAVRSSDIIGSPSNGNIEFTLKYHPEAKQKNIHILHYSQYPINIKPETENIRNKYGLTGKFIAIYGGNMSIAQKIDNVIDLAKSCLEFDDIEFLLLGRGQDIESSKNKVLTHNLSNVKFIDFLPQSDYYQLLSICDVGLVSLNEKLAVPNIPSKTLSYFNLSIPIIASIDKVTDFGEYLEDAGAGFWSYAGDIESFKNNLIRLYQSPELRKQMGQNGYNFYKKNMVPKVAYQTIINNLALIEKTKTNLK